MNSNKLKYATRNACVHKNLDVAIIEDKMVENCLRCLAMRLEMIEQAARTCTQKNIMCGSLVTCKCFWSLIRKVPLESPKLQMLDS